MSADSRDRLQLFEQLAGLPSDRFEALLLELAIPAGLISPSKTRQGDRVTDLLEWVRGSTGCGLEHLVSVLARIEAGELGATGIDFAPYLQSILTDEDYREGDEVYTTTTVQGQKPEPQAKFSKRLKLRVETVKRDKEQSFDSRSAQGAQEQREQIEQWDVLAGLRNYAAEHVLLVGKPGSGKSTSLERLLWEEAENALQNAETKIPVLVKLRRCTSTLEQLIQDFFSCHELSLTVTDIAALLQQGKLLLLLDGLNELPDSFGTAAANFRDRYRKTTPMIVSTRDLAVGGTLGITKTLKMLPLTEPQMQEFVRGYLGDEGDKLFQQLKGDRLRKFAETPLLLWMLCWVFVQNGQVPANLGLAFREFTQLYDQKIQEDAPAESKGQWPKLLRHLAFALMHDKELVEFRLSMSREEAEKLLTDCLQQEGRTNARELAEKGLQDLLDYHLLQPFKQANLEEHIEFRHQLIQEYYAAEYLLRLLRGLNDEQLKQGYLNLMKWTEPIALMLALVDEEEQALRVVRLAINDVDLMLGARLAGNAKHNLQVSAVSSVNDLSAPLKLKIKLLGETKSFAAIPCLSPLIESNEAFTKNETIKALGKINNASSIDALKKALEDSDKNIRWMAACEVARFGDESAISALQESLCVEKHHFRALLAIESIDRDKVVPLLGETLTHADLEARRKAITSLNLLINKGYGGILPFLEIALHDEDSRTRRSAAHALRDVGSEEALSILAKGWIDDDMQVRNFVCIALKKDALNFLENDLINALRSNNSTAKERAIEVVTRTQSISKTIAEELLNVAFFDSHFLVRNSASTALVIVDELTVIHVLEKVFAEDDFKITRYSSKHSVAISILLQKRKKESIPILIKALSNEHENLSVKTFAIKALGEIGDPAVIPFLRENFKRAKKELGNISSVFEFKRIYIQTLLALGKLGVENLEQFIVEILEDASSADDIRKDCIETLGKIPTEASKSALVRSLHNPKFKIRLSAALILAKEGVSDSIPVLIEALGYRNSIGSEDSSVSRDAIGALCELGEDCLEVLEAESSSQDSQARKNARLAVEKINGNSNDVSHDNLSAEQSAGDHVRSMIDRLTNEYSFSELIEALRIADSDEAWKFASSLKEIIQPNQIHCLRKFLLESDSDNFFTYIPNLISTIQSCCKFYNYEIWQDAVANQNSKLEMQEKGRHTTGDKGTNIYIETLQANNSAINLGGTIGGDQIGTQNQQPKP